MQKAGFRELEHTADWSLQVWASDLEELFTTAAKGMNALAQVKLQSDQMVMRNFRISALDLESLLVLFLEELLFFGEDEDLAFDQFSVRITNKYELTAEVLGGKIGSRKKEIKAVTYHNLNIEEGEKGYQVEVVFDV